MTINEIETSEVPALIPAEAEIDKLTKFRGLQPEKKTLSTAQKAKLQDIKDSDRVTAIAATRFASGLKLVVVNHENLKQLIFRCYSKGITNPETGEYIAYGYLNDGIFQKHTFDENCGCKNLNARLREHNCEIKHLDNRALKLNWWIEAGYLLGREIDTPTLIRFFSELTADEEKMSDSKFASEWDEPSAKEKRASRIRRKLISEDVKPDVKPQTQKPKERLCTSGKLCIRYEHRKPALAKGTGRYCSRNCAASYAIRKANRTKDAQKAVLGHLPLGDN